MSTILIGSYESPDDAERARRELIAAGVPESRIALHGGHADNGNPSEPLPEDRGIAGFIGRMFSGFTGDAENIRKYEDVVGRGGATLAVADIRHEDVDRLRAIMAGGGNVDVHENRGKAAPARRGYASEGRDVEPGPGLGPEGNALPNAPTGWRSSRAGSPSGIGELAHDPARPEGLTNDAAGLDSASDRDRLERVEPAPADARASTGEGAPDAHGHRVAADNPGRDRAVPSK